jgi:hypothetical protein
MVDETYTSAITAALQLRSRLVPYVYTAARVAYDTGIATSYVALSPFVNSAVIVNNAICCGSV